MSKLLFCIDSYYQLIISINLKINIYINDEVDLVLFKTMQNAEKIYKNLLKCGLFRKVYLAETNLNMTKTNSNLIQRFPKYFDYLYSMFSPVNYTKKLFNIERIDFYNELFFYGYRPLIQCIFNACYRVNKNIKCYRMDDGMGSYIKEWNLPKPILRLILEKAMLYTVGFENIEKHIVGFYVPDPKLIKYNLTYELIKLPDYSNPILKETLNKLFEFEYDAKLCKKSIIYFGMYGKQEVQKDIVFLNEISSYIQKEQIAIKVHPRENKNSYMQLNIDVMDKSSSPWELFMINYNFNNVLFVSQMSSAVLSSRIVFNRKGKDVYLYKCKNPTLNKTTYLYDDVDVFLKNYKDNCDDLECIFAPTSFAELKKIFSSADIKEKLCQEKK